MTKYYRPIAYVEMANSTELYTVDYLSKEETEEGLQDLIDNEDLYSIEQYKTKKSMLLEVSGDVYVKGYGIHAGRKVWQLPPQIQRLIAKDWPAVSIELTESDI